MRDFSLLSIFETGKQNYKKKHDSIEMQVFQHLLTLFQKALQK